MPSDRPPPTLETSAREPAGGTEVWPVTAYQFRVTGTDSRGEPTEFMSRAPTEELARKSAVAMGIVPGSVQRVGGFMKDGRA